MQSLSPRRFRPATVDELRLCLAEAGPGDLIEPPRDDIKRLLQPVDPLFRHRSNRLGQVVTYGQALEAAMAVRKPDLQRHVVESLALLPTGWRPIATMPFADLKQVSDRAEGVVQVANQDEQALVVVRRRANLPLIEWELPAWWFTWELAVSKPLRVLGHDLSVIDFLPSHYSLLPRFSTASA